MTFTHNDCNEWLCYCRTGKLWAQTRMGTMTLSRPSPTRAVQPPPLQMQKCQHHQTGVGVGSWYLAHSWFMLWVSEHSYSDNRGDLFKIFSLIWTCSRRDHVFLRNVRCRADGSLWLRPRIRLLYSFHTGRCDFRVMIHWMLLERVLRCLTSDSINKK